jgi:hypothetical protein
MKKLTRKQLAAKLTADWARIDALAAPDTTELCYVEPAGENAFAVKWKPYPEAMGETVVIDTFPSEQQANDYCALMNQMRMDYLRVDAARAADGASAPTAYAAADGSDLPTETLLAVPILDAGSWTAMGGQKVTYSKADLAEMVANFEPLKKTLTPRFKLGHIFNEDQRARTGAPAIGWLDTVRLSNDGNTILADIVSVPAKVVALIKAKAYRRISTEIRHNFTDSTGKVWRLALDAAGLLGAQLPACNTLGDVIKHLYGEGAQATALLTPIEGGELFALSEPIPQEESAMNEVQLAALCTTLGLPANADPSAIQAAAAALKIANTETTAELAEHAEAALTAGIDAQMLRAKKEGRMVPTQEAGLRAMVNGWKVVAAQNEGVMEFAAVSDGNTINKKGSVVEAFAAFVDSLPAVFKGVQELGSGQKPEKVQKSNVAPDTLRFATTGLGRQIGFDRRSIDRDARVREFAAKNNVTYLAAYDAVISQEG